MTHTIPSVEHTVPCLWSVMNALNAVQGNFPLEKDLYKPIDVITHIYQIMGLVLKSVGLIGSTVKICGVHLQVSKNSTKYTDI